MKGPLCYQADADLQTLHLLIVVQGVGYWVSRHKALQRGGLSGSKELFSRDMQTGQRTGCLLRGQRPLLQRDLS